MTSNPTLPKVAINVCYHLCVQSLLQGLVAESSSSQIRALQDIDIWSLNEVV